MILADSGSTDRTISISKKFPIKIFQLKNPQDRSCGAAAQLAFQHSSGEFFYLVDADMIVHKEFVTSAINYLEKNEGCAGVGGFIQERQIENQEFVLRAAALKRDRDKQLGIVSRLDGGGIYRSAAIREIGYFADRNLHSFEELDLGARLRQQNWKLVRFKILAADHFGHRLSGYKLLLLRLTSGYARGTGEVLKASFGRPHFYLILREFKHIRNSAIVIAWWLVIGTCIMVLPLGSLLMASVFFFFSMPIFLFSYQKGSLSLGIYKVAQWNITALGAVLGLFSRRIRPQTPLPSIMCK